jgi:hypothetical protein
LIETTGILDSLESKKSEVIAIVRFTAKKLYVSEILKKEHPKDKDKYKIAFSDDISDAYRIKDVYEYNILYRMLNHEVEFIRLDIKIDEVNITNLVLRQLH